MTTPTHGPVTEEKKSFFARFRGGEKKPKKEKRKKEKKEKKAKKEKKEKEPSKKNIFGKEKKVPREELNAEIEALKAELHETRIRYNELQRWANNPPVNAY